MSLTIRTHCWSVRLPQRASSDAAEALYHHERDGRSGFRGDSVPSLLSKLACECSVPSLPSNMCDTGTGAEGSRWILLSTPITQDGLPLPCARF